MTTKNSKNLIGSLISYIKPKSHRTNAIFGVLFSLVLFNAAPTVSANEIPSHYGYLELNIVSSNQSYFTEFYFNSNATQGLDPGYDASVFGANPPSFSIYSHLVQNDIGMAYAIQALNNTDMSNITVPLGINANEGQNINISITETDIPESINIYIEDRETNTLKRLNDSAFNLTATTDLSGIGRFYLIFAAESLSTTEQAIDKLEIYTSNSNNTLTVKGGLNSDTELRLFSINGSLVNYIVMDKSNTEHTLNTFGLSAGVYVVKLTTKDSRNRTEKIIIQ